MKTHLTIKDEVFHMDGEFARLEKIVISKIVYFFNWKMCFVSLEIFRGQ